MRSGARQAGVSVLVKALGLVRIVEENAGHRRLKARDIAEIADIPLSTAYRLLSVLSQHGYLRQDRRDHAYELGPKLAQATLDPATEQSLSVAARPLMERLASLSGETISLGVLERTYVRIAVRFSPPSSDAPATPEAGQMRPLHCTGLGKSLLGWSPAAERARLLDTISLEPITRNSVVDSQTLEGQLTKAREMGFVIEHGEIIEGISCVSVPILDRAGHALAAISISGATQRMDADRCRALVPELLLLAEALRVKAVPARNSH